MSSPQMRGPSARLSAGGALIYGRQLRGSGSRESDSLLHCVLASHLRGNAAGQIAGLVCLGDPFHPPKQPTKLRIAHLERLGCPTLIVQGERDPFGPHAEVEAMLAAGRLSPAIRFHWAGDGDHDLGPRGGSGFTRKGNLASAADAVAAFAAALVDGAG